MKKRLIVVLAAVLFSVCISTAVAEDEAAADEFVSTWKHPAPGFTTYGDIRLRQKYGWKMTDLNDSHHNFGRYRARIGERIEAAEDVTFDVRLMWEFRAYDDGGDNHVDFGYALVDRLNVKLENMFDAPLTGVFGRQDIMINQWLIFDGVPFTGSTMVFFDAARLTYDFEDSATKLDMIYIDNRADSKDRISAIGHTDFYLTEQNENGAILYLTNKSIEDTTIEGYFIYKNDRSLGTIDNTKLNPRMNPNWSRKGEIFTFGGALSQKIDANWDYRAEAAIQTGDKELGYMTGNMRDLRAWGTNNRLSYSFRDKRNNSLRVEYEFLSGDDGTGGTDHGFDPLWGQWPRFSELYIYTYSLESSIAEVTNMHRAGAFHSFDPVEKMKLENGFQLLWADEMRTGGAFTGSSSHFRGQLFTSCLSYKFTKDLTGRLNAEYFIPGNYYGPDNQEDATFLRAEIVYSF